MPYQVDKKNCEACGACVDACPNGAIKLKDLAAEVNPDLCVDCGSCESICPAGAIKPD
ncbi:MAG: 4Fe-4S binding protein [Verrucomicrobiales bacterium]|jgi:NAD-dependent dihydropyrimidine dehydrogenase PreA subunit|nr:4Fe-4S binding protein [Verrucomicrobiales bacterium]